MLYCDHGNGVRFGFFSGSGVRHQFADAEVPASDPKKFGSWSSHFMTEYHARYGGNGVMIYWHVERKNVCIYSQLKSCSSSEVAAMIEGLLRHWTDAEIESNYVATHGASVVGFAFTELLSFRLLPRLKNIGSIRLYRPDDTPPGLPALGPSLTRPIRWDLIEQQYDQMVKYATALRLGTAEAEQVLRRFNRGGPKHPTYQALEEPGRAVVLVQPQPLRHLPPGHGPATRPGAHGAPSPWRDRHRRSITCGDAMTNFRQPAVRQAGWCVRATADRPRHVRRR